MDRPHETILHAGQTIVGQIRAAHAQHLRTHADIPTQLFVTETQADDLVRECEQGLCRNGHLKGKDLRMFMGMDVVFDPTGPRVA